MRTRGSRDRARVWRVHMAARGLYGPPRPLGDRAQPKLGDCPSTETAAQTRYRPRQPLIFGKAAMVG
jgi:hypothetical protein